MKHSRCHDPFQKRGMGGSLGVTLWMAVPIGPQHRHTNIHDHVVQDGLVRANPLTLQRGY